MYFVPIGALRRCVVNVDERQAACGKYCKPSHVLKIMLDHRGAPLPDIEPSGSVVVRPPLLDQSCVTDV
jgi:hypothetical protein